jgi:hypothetical protein
MMESATFRRLKSGANRPESTKHGEARVARDRIIYDVERPQRPMKLPRITVKYMRELWRSALLLRMANAAYFAFLLSIRLPSGANQRKSPKARAGGSLPKYIMVKIYLNIDVVNQRVLSNTY